MFFSDGGYSTMFGNLWFVFHFRMLHLLSVHKIPQIQGLRYSFRASGKQANHVNHANVG